MSSSRGTGMATRNTDSILLKPGITHCRKML
jgi:hypothetical protein